MVVTIGSTQRWCRASRELCSNYLYNNAKIISKIVKKYSVKYFCGTTQPELRSLCATELLSCWVSNATQEQWRSFRQTAPLAKAIGSRLFQSIGLTSPLAVFFLFLYAKNIFRKSRKLFGSLQFAVLTLLLVCDKFIITLSVFIDTNI